MLNHWWIADKVIFEIFFEKNLYYTLSCALNSESNDSNIKPSKSRGGAREQIVLKICKPISGPPTHYMTSSWVSKWSSINCAWTDGARFLIPEVLPVLFKNEFCNISPSAKRIYFVIKIDQSQQTIARNDQWNLRIISIEKNLGLRSNYNFRLI